MAGIWAVGCFSNINCVIAFREELYTLHTCKSKLDLSEYYFRNPIGSVVTLPPPVLKKPYVESAAMGDNCLDAASNIVTPHGFGIPLESRRVMKKVSAPTIKRMPARVDSGKLSARKKPVKKPLRRCLRV